MSDSRKIVRWYVYENLNDWFLGRPSNRVDLPANADPVSVKERVMLMYGYDEQCIIERHSQAQEKDDESRR